MRANGDESSHNIDRTVIVAMAVMRMMQPAIYEIAGVVAMRDCLMTATGTVHMVRIMAKVMRTDRCAARWVFGRNFDYVFFNTVSVLVMQVAVVEIIDMITVPNGGVAATGPVNMTVVRVVPVVACHQFSPSCSGVWMVSSAAWSSMSRKRCAT